MRTEHLLWAALAALAALSGLAAAWWGRTRFVRGRRALLAAGVFLVVGLAGGFFAHGPLAEYLAHQRLAEAEVRCEQLFRADALLRALVQAEPERAAQLHTRLVQALAAPEEPDPAPLESRIRLDALRIALGAAFVRLPNASDEAAARLADALLECLRSLQKTDALLCLGVMHPASDTDAALTQNALARLDPAARKQLEGALALTLASSALRPQAAPPPAKTDAALSDMFMENLPDFQRTYGDSRQVDALFAALAEPERGRSIAPQTLCAFAQDLLHALLRMPPAERGPGLRRLLGG